MAKRVIQAEDLSKNYIIRHQQGSYLALRDVIANKVKRILRNAPDPTRETFYALDGVSFNVEQGERVGIIGRNGAGKSTLLKLLSRITLPSRGRITLTGRVASLLEVGTGFHPELTGRENIFLNGAILGMTRVEIKQKFDEIVEFAGVSKFLDTPVKRFSSGMYVRLGFAVAAHLEPEILIVDEVLAVGDANFQKKCLGKMEEVTQEGRTVLFVSHNMQAIRNLCPRSILLHHGKMVIDAPTDETLRSYSDLLRDIEIDEETGIQHEQFRRGTGAVRFVSVELLDAQGNRRLNFDMGDDIHMRIRYQIYEEMNGLSIYFGLRSGLTRDLITTAFHVLSEERLPPGTKGSFTLKMPKVSFRPGEYPVYLCLSEKEHNLNIVDRLDDLTAPLMISVGDAPLEHKNFDTSRPIGYFSFHSEILDHDQQEGNT